MSELNEKIRILLADNGWTQTKLADLVGYTPGAVHRWVKGVNLPSIDTIKKICEVFSIPIQDLLNDEYDIPEYIILDQYLPYRMCYMPEELQDSIHIIIDANLSAGGLLHRFKNAAGVECSAIYQGSSEIWWHYREHEPRMIHDWNERYRL